MDIPHVDFTKPNNIVVEMFDDDRWVKDEFNNKLAQGCLAFAEKLALCFENYQFLEKFQAQDKQAAMVANFVFGVMDDLVVSMKLMVTGKMIASGNMMRQVIEGVCVAILCSSPKPIQLSKTEEVVYWEIASDPEEKRARSHKALANLKDNADILGIEPNAIARLEVARKKYNNFSHPNLLSTATRMQFGELSKVFVGGTFDDQKIDAYRAEINERIGIASILPGLIRHLADVLKARPKTAA